MKHLLYISFFFTVSSCFLLEPATEDTKLKDEAIAYRLLENKLKDSIRAYINLHIKKENELYSSYEFSEVYEQKPQEIKDYEALVKKRERLPYLENKYHEFINIFKSKYGTFI